MGISAALFLTAVEVSRLLEANHVPAVGIAVIRDGELRQVAVS